MGLDVYLRRYENFGDFQAREKAAEEATDALYKSRFPNEGDYDKLTKEQQLAFWEESRNIERSHGTYYGEEVGRTGIRLDSTQYPDHHFKVGYFRSSYNDGGINSVGRRLGLPGLYEIFDPGDDYEFAPDWSGCKERANSVLAQWRAKASELGDLSVRAFDGNPFIVPTIHSESEAMAVYQKTIARGSSFDAYETGEGFFTKDPLQVLAVIQGTKERLGRPAPCQYLIVRDPGAYEFYIHALEIVLETINYVLSQPDPEKYILHWSG